MNNSAPVNQDGVLTVHKVKVRFELDARARIPRLTNPKASTGATLKRILNGLSQMNVGSRGLSPAKLYMYTVWASLHTATTTEK